MKINALYLEDNPSDAELLAATIATEGEDIRLKVISTLEELRESLGTPVDVIVSDYNLGSFTGEDALVQTRRINQDIPFIIFSSTIGDEQAVALIHKGATDFVLKDNIRKMPTVIERAYNEWLHIMEHTKFKKELEEKSALLSTMFDSLVDLVIIKSSAGNITEANRSFCEFFGMKRDQVLDKAERHFISGSETRRSDEIVINEEKPHIYQVSINDSEGKLHVLEVTKTPLMRDGIVTGIVSMMRDISEKIRNEEVQSRTKRVLQEAESLTLSGSFEYDDDNDILAISANFCDLLNFPRETPFISFKKLTQCIYPDDRNFFIARFEDSVQHRKPNTLSHRYLAVGSDQVRYCQTIIKPHNTGDKVVFYGIIQDVTEARETNLSLLYVQERERSNIARELHDNLGQKLSAASMLLNNGGQVEKVQSVLDNAIEEIRNLSRNLSTAILDERHLLEAIQELVSQFEQSISISFNHNIEDTAVGDFEAGHLYRIAQEAMNNTMKYGKARSMEIQLMRQGDTLAFEVKDNGIGFDPDKVKRGNGLRNIEERTRICHGEYSIRSQEGVGTQINIKIPLNVQTSDSR